MKLFRPARAAGDPGAEDTLLEPAGPVEARWPEPAVAVDGELAALLEALPPGHALLVVHHGPQAGARYLLDRDVTGAGRDARQDILLDDATVSRRHAEFVRTGEGFAVRDLNSLNGTYVGGRRVAGAPLRAGDVVRIGKFRLVYHPRPVTAARQTWRATASPAPTVATNRPEASTW